MSERLPEISVVYVKAEELEEAISQPDFINSSWDVRRGYSVNFCKEKNPKPCSDCVMQKGCTTFRVNQLNVAS